MSVERILVVFNEDGTIKGIASYAPNGAAEEMTPEAFLAHLPEVALLAQVQALQATQQANERRATDAEADRDAKVAEKDARIAGLEAQLAVPPPVDDSIHAAYVKQALYDMQCLDEVSGAAAAAGLYQMWDNATSFTLREPMVVNVAGVLGIDLAEVRTRAIAIRDNTPLDGNSGE